MSQMTMLRTKADLLWPCTSNFGSFSHRVMASARSRRGYHAFEPLGAAELLKASESWLEDVRPTLMPRQNNFASLHGCEYGGLLCA